jgi:hypothetical protein
MDLHRGVKAGFDCDHRARNRHSDNEKFCNDPNETKPPKMLERPLKNLQDFQASRLNTRVRFPSPRSNVFSPLSFRQTRLPTAEKATISTAGASFRAGSGGCLE